jgi:hypothetical protein
VSSSIDPSDVTRPSRVPVAEPPVCVWGWGEPPRPEEEEEEAGFATVTYVGQSEPFLATDDMI